MERCNNVIGNLDLSCIVQNQYFTILLKFTSEGNPLDLSIYESVFFDAFYSDKTVLRKTLENGITINDNEMTIQISQKDSEKLPQINLTYELRLVNEMKQNLYVLKGNFELIKTISR